MKITLDTNVIRQNLSLDSKKIVSFLKFVEITRSQIFLSKVVLDEAAQQFINEIKSRREDAAALKEKVAGLHIPSIAIEVKDFNEEEERKNYYNRIVEAFSLSSANIMIPKNEWLPEFIDKAIRKIMPFRDDKDEMRDAIIWKSIALEANASNDEVAFITSNFKDFMPEKTLHWHLKKELKFPEKFYTYRNLDEFLTAHSTKVEFIDDAWIEKNFDEDELAKEILSEVKSGLKKTLSRRIKSKFKSFDSIESICLTQYKKITSYYIESFSKNIELILTIEIEIEVECFDEFEQDSEYEMDRRFNPRSGSYEIDYELALKQTRRNRFPTRYVIVEAIISSVINNMNLESHEIAEIEFHVESTEK